MLEFQNLCFSYGKKRIFVNVSITFPQSGLILIYGPSGCGKTTLLRICAGLCKPTSGKVILPKNAKISIDFQEPRLFDQLTVAENISTVTGESADALLSEVELGDSADKYPGELSGGMKKRVSLARAIGYGGDIILLDEPTSGLDSGTRDRVMPLIRRASKTALVLMITHDETIEDFDGIIRLTPAPNNNLCIEKAR